MLKMHLYFCFSSVQPKHRVFGFAARLAHTCRRHAKGISIASHEPLIVRITQPSQHLRLCPRRQSVRFRNRHTHGFGIVQALCHQCHLPLVAIRHAHHLAKQFGGVTDMLIIGPILRRASHQQHQCASQYRRGAFPTYHAGCKSSAHVWSTLTPKV